MFKDYYKDFKLKNEEKPSSERIGAIIEAVLSEKEVNDMKDNSKKPRKFAKKAIIIPVAAVLAAGAVTASAATNFGLFDRFAKFFEQNGSDPASIALTEEDIEKYEDVFERENYNLIINGLYCDKYTTLISYDIEYKADKYFEDGKLRDDMLVNGSPVAIYSNPGQSSGGAGSTFYISHEGNIVSYVDIYDYPAGLYSGERSEFDLDLDIQFYDFFFYDDPENPVAVNFTESDPGADLSKWIKKLQKTVPVAKSVSALIDSDIRVGDMTVRLDRITASSLSVCMEFIEPEEWGRYDSTKFENAQQYLDQYSDFRTNYTDLISHETLSVTLKDGTVIDGMNNCTFVGGEQALVINYGTVIDPDDIIRIKYANCTVTFENGEAADITVDS